MEDTDKLRELKNLRKEYTMKLVELEEKEGVLWENLRSELMDDISYYRGVKGLEELIAFNLHDIPNNYKLLVLFKKGFIPTLDGLKVIEDKTGLKMLGNPDDVSIYQFIL